MAKPVPPRAPQQAAQRLLVRYAKRGKMRFASHRDVARAFERGIRRAGLPIAYSAGFTPHPKISYAGGAPTGVASEAEYLTLALTSPQDPGLVRQRLDQALPDGIDVVEVTLEGEGVEAEASEWIVELPGVTADEAELAVAGFLALEQAPVERLTDKGVRRMDARKAVAELTVLRGGRRAAVTTRDDCAILRMVVLHVAPAVRPEDVLTALRAGHGVVPSAPPFTTRLAQGPLARIQQADGSRAGLTGNTLS